MSERIVVFDIEVLNQDPTSICSIGIVEMIDLKITSTYYSLIKPRSLAYDPYRYRVHKIKSKKLIHQPRFCDIWEDIRHYFENSIVVSHDIQGDMMYLRETLKYYHIPYPCLHMSCTNVLAHLVLPDLKKYNLSELALRYHISFEAHHALEDAKASALLLIELLKEKGCSSLKEIHQLYHLDFGEMRENYYRNMIASESVPQLLQLVEKEDSYLYHQSVCFTGKLDMPKNILEEKTKAASALYSQHVSGQTNYLVIGKKGYSKVRFGHQNKKVLKALQLKKKGQDIQIIHENEYLRLLERKKTYEDKNSEQR